MQAGVWVLTTLVLTGARAAVMQSTSADHRQNDTKQVSGAPASLDGATGLNAKQSGEERMEDRQVTTFTHMMDAVNAGDAQRYAALYAQDAVITIYGGGELKGRDAIEQHEVHLLRDFPGTRLAFYAVWQKGALAAVHYGVNGRTAAGQPMGHEGLLFYRFHPSGLIAEEHRYLDGMTPMAQLGLLGAAPARALPVLPSELKVYAAGSSSQEEANVALVTASFAALEAKKAPAFLAAVAEEAVVDELIYPQPFNGKQKVKAWFEAWTSAAPDAITEITTLLGAGEFVLVETVVRGTLQGPFGRLAASHKPFAVHRAAIIQVKEGKLARMSMFMNGKELAEATGQWPPPMGK